jgi:hypothetical protein
MGPPADLPKFWRPLRADDSDSDSEFWGGLAARAAAAKRRRTLADFGGNADFDTDAASLRLSRAAAAAQHPIFDLTNAEVRCLCFCSIHIA